MRSMPLQLVQGHNRARALRPVPEQRDVGGGQHVGIACLCNAGFTESNAQCVRCAPNTYKASAGPAPCDNCTAFSSSPAGSVSAFACVCNLSYSLTSGACAPCAAGSYGRGGTDIDALLARNVPFITSLASDWNAVTQKFDSNCAGQTCAGNTGGMSAGIVTTGTVVGNGAGGHGHRVPGSHDRAARRDCCQRVRVRAGLLARRGHVPDVPGEHVLCRRCGGERVFWKLDNKRQT